MEYNNNLNISLGLMGKYEIYRILKLYAYLFVITSIFAFFNTFIDISVLMMIFVVSILIIPLIYSLVLYYVINSRKINFSLEIKTSHIVFLVIILFVFFYVKGIIYFLLNPVTPTFNFYYITYAQYEILYSSSFSFFINYLFIKKLKIKANMNIFLYSAIILFIIWINEIIPLLSFPVWIVYVVFGVFVYIYSYIFLREDEIEG